MAYFADRVKDTTTSTGTGAITLANSAPTGYRTFASALGSGADQEAIPYTIELNGEWEVGLGTFNGTTGLTRDIVLASSNSGALVNFSAGTKNVFLTLPADLVMDAGVVQAMQLGQYSI
jgi:hypothetical protein